MDAHFEPFLISAGEWRLDAVGLEGKDDAGDAHVAAVLFHHAGVVEKVLQNAPAGKQFCVKTSNSK